MKGWTLQQVRSLMPEEYEELVLMLEDEQKKRTDGAEPED